MKRMQGECSGKEGKPMQTHAPRTSTTAYSTMYALLYVACPLECKRSNRCIKLMLDIKPISVSDASEASKTFAK
jgi:hypothetical protein